MIVLHVIDERHTASLQPNLLQDRIEDYKNRMLKDTEEFLIKIEEELKETGLDVKSQIRTGVPLREILKAEEEENVSVIVIGSHGKTNLKEMFLGSVSEKVIRKCKKPVLVIKR